MMNAEFCDKYFNAVVSLESMQHVVNKEVILRKILVKFTSSCCCIIIIMVVLVLVEA